MRNLYTLEQTAAEVAQTFDVVDDSMGANAGSLVYPGYPGLVIAEGEARWMTWGFPLAPKSEKTGELLNPSRSTMCDPTSSKTGSGGTAS